MEHYEQGDYKYAAIEHGKRLVSQLNKLGFENKIATAIHFRTDDAGNHYWHYHFVGLGDPVRRLYGKNGALNDAWYFTNVAKDKPIVNELEHKLEMDKVGEILVISKQLQQLNRDRRKAIRAADKEDKNATRETFNVLEEKLINKLFILQRERIDHHYAARADSGSTSHQIEHENNINELAASLARIADRGQSLEVKKANKKAKRKKAVDKKRNIVKKSAKQIVTKIGISNVTELVVTSPLNAVKQLSNNESTNDRSIDTAKAVADMAKKAIIDTAKLAAKVAVTGVKLATVSISNMLPISKLSLLNSATNHTNNSTNKHTNNHTSSLLNTDLTKFDIALAKARANSFDYKNQEPIDAVKIAVELSSTAVIAAQACATIAKDVATLSPVKAVTNTVIGGLEINKKSN